MTRGWNRARACLALAALGAVAGGAIIAAPPARACSCLETSGAELWPLRDAVDVPLDTPIVVQRRSFSVDPSSIPIRLLDSDGREVELTETRRLEQLELECWAEQTVFLHPAEPLAPNATYTLTVGEGEGRSFTTGSGLYQPSEYPSPRIRYAHVGPAGECSDDDEWCDIGELEIGFDTAIADGLWLVLRSHADKDNENRWVFAEWARSEPSQQLSVLLPSDDPCVELTLYGVDGSVVLERELCEPDACVLYGGRGLSTCGEPASSTLRVDRLPQGGCDAPITIEDGREGPVYPEPDPSAPDSGAGAPIDAGAGATRDAGEPASGGTGGAPPIDPDASDSAGAAEPAQRASGCSCSLLGRAPGTSPSATSLLAMLGLVGLARRRTKKAPRPVDPR